MKRRHRRLVRETTDRITFARRVGALIVEADYFCRFVKTRRPTRTGMPRFERHRKARALARWEFLIQAMHRRARGACCTSCAFGSEYDDALTMVERIRAELGLPDDD